MDDGLVVRDEPHKKKEKDSGKEEYSHEDGLSTLSEVIYEVTQERLERNANKRDGSIDAPDYHLRHTQVFPKHGKEWQNWSHPCKRNIT